MRLYNAQGGKKMNNRATERYEAIERYERGKLTAKELRTILEVSKSQTYKILQRYRAEGVLGLFHKKKLLSR